MNTKRVEALCIRLSMVFLLTLCGAGTVWAKTYYIDYVSGNDSNNGTSKATPWQRHPYMQAFAGSGYVHSTGDIFVFKGGVIWPSTCFNMSIPSGGSAGKIDTYTVDQTWYSGSSWTRPVFDGGTTTLTTSQSMISFSSLSYVTFDSIEVRNWYATNNQNMGMFYMYGCNYIQWTNCYLHGWTLAAGIAKDDAHGPIIHVVSGGLSMTGMVIDACEISNAELTGSGRQSGVAVRQVNTIRNSKLHDVSSGVLFCGDFYGNDVYNVGYPAGNQSFDNGASYYHTNVLYLDMWNGAASPAGIPGHVYNNRFHDLGAYTPSIYPNSGLGVDVQVYVYNNIMYGAQASYNYFLETDPYPGSGSFIEIYVMNNTVVFPNSGPNYLIKCVTRSGTQINLVVAENNHCIGSQISMESGPCATLTQDHNLTQTAAIAAGQGYVLGNLYAPVAGGASIDMGASEAAYFATDILGSTRPSGVTWDIGAYESKDGATVSPPKGLRIK